MSRSTVTLLSLFIVSAITFVLAPGIDLLFTGLFYESGKGFFLSDNPVVQFSYRYNKYLTLLVVLLLIGALATNLIRKRKLLGLDRKAATFLLLTLLIGPGLIVNTVFKNNWGRARPDNVEQFGGTGSFSPAFVISNQCKRNCSFVSGHASVGFYFIAFGLLLNGRRKVKVILISGILGGLIGLGRIVQGDHFLSDVVFAFFFVVLTAKLLYYLIYQKGWPFNAAQPQRPD